LTILADEVHQAVTDGSEFPERMFLLQPFIGNGFIFKAKGDGYGEFSEPLPCRWIVCEAVSSGRNHGTLTSGSVCELFSNIV
jgi:hypothetical protein